MSALDRGLLAGPCASAARALVGARLVREDASGRRVGRIVEVEAYGGIEDRASHARFGATPRNQVMFGSPGVAYVYLVYGMYECLNVVAEPDGSAAAVLIRAVEPVEGVDAMRAARVSRTRQRRAGAQRSGETDVAPAVERIPVPRLASGPGRLGDAFGIDRGLTGTDLLAPGAVVRLEAPAADDRPVIVATPRIGIAHAGEPWVGRPWRFVDAASPALSVGLRRR